MVRSAFGDREHQSIFLTTGSPTTGCTRGYSEFDPLQRIIKRENGSMYVLPFFNKFFPMQGFYPLHVDNYVPIEFLGHVNRMWITPKAGGCQSL